MWGISYFKLDSLKERKFAFQRIKFAFQRIKFAFQRFKFAFQRIKFAFQRIKFAFQRIKFAFQRIKFAFQRIKFAFQRIKFAFQRIKFAFQRIKFASKESSCCKVVVSSVVHRTVLRFCQKKKKKRKIRFWIQESVFGFSQKNAPLENKVIVSRHTTNITSKHVNERENLVP